MRCLLLVLLVLPFTNWGQNNTVFQVWNEAGIAYKLDKKQSFAFDFTTRHNASGLQTYFPQISYKYKVNKMIRPSIDYRFIGDKNQEGNYTFRHRLNANLQFDKELERFELGFRMRYQYSSSRLDENFEPEFGEALRYKTSIAYDIKKSALSPKVSVEFFTGPMDGQVGYLLNRIRLNFGLSYDLTGAHSVQIAYLYDQRINSQGALNRAILNFSYGYSIGKQKEKAPVKPQRNGRFL
jgi:hypothetical protein